MLTDVTYRVTGENKWAHHGASISDNACVCWRPLVRRSSATAPR
jgi:hypothetical protein